MEMGEGRSVGDLLWKMSRRTAPSMARGLKGVSGCLNGSQARRRGRMVVKANPVLEMRLTISYVRRKATERHDQLLFFVFSKHWVMFWFLDIRHATLHPRFPTRSPSATRPHGKRERREAVLKPSAAGDECRLDTDRPGYQIGGVAVECHDCGACEGQC